MNLIKKVSLFQIRVFRAFCRKWRRFYLKYSLNYLGKNCEFGSGIIIQGHEFIRIDDNCRINDHVVMQSGRGGELSLGKNVTVSFGARIMTGQYEVGASGHNRSHHIYEPVIIENGVWVGCNAVILPGVQIGEYSIIAAGSVVLCDVPPHVLVAGIPAKVKKEFIG